MSLHQRPLNVNGNYWGEIYTFDKAGDVFADHMHPTEDVNHITMVLFGAIKLTGDGEFAGIVVDAQPGGTIIHLPAGKTHGFVAMTDGATIGNFFSSLRRPPCPQ